MLLPHQQQQQQRQRRQDEFVNSNDSQIVRETLRIYGSIYLASLLIFMVVRKFYPKLFNIRSWSSVNYSKLAIVNYGWLSWFWDVFKVTDEELLEHCGMDAICFLRALSFGRRLCFMGCVNALWLIPCYVTAKASEETSYLADPFVIISVSHLPSASQRFIGTVLASYVMYLYAMFLILREYKWYISFRHAFLAQRTPRNYAICVSGIPPPYRSSQQLQNYFSQGGVAVLEAHLTMETNKLDKLVQKRQALVRKLEHAVALERRTGKTTTHVAMRGRHRTLETVASVTEFAQEYEELGAEIQRRQQEVSENNHGLRARFSRSRPMRSNDLLKAIQADVKQEESKRSLLSPSRKNTLESCISVEQGGTPKAVSSLSTEFNLEQGADEAAEADVSPRHENEESAVELSVLHKEGAMEEQQCIATEPEPLGNDDSFTQNDSLGNSGRSNLSDSSPRRRQRIADSIVAGTKGVVGGINQVGSAIHQGSRAASNTLVNGSRAAGTTFVNTSSAVGTTLAKGSRVAGAHTNKLIQHAGGRGVELAQNVGVSVLESAGAVVPLLVHKAEGNARDSGFVVFKTLYATQTALQMIHHPKPYTFTTAPPGDPRNIFWRNVGLPHRAKRSGLLASAAATAILCFFWSVPMAIISSLTELNSLKEELPKLGEWLEDKPRMEKFFALLAPLVLLFFNEAILPTVLKYFATWEGHISSSMLEASLFVKLGCFMIIQTFFVSAISGGITAELSNILENPKMIIDLLANSLPAQSSYFIQVALAQTFFLQSMEILRLYPLLLAFIRKFVGPRLTVKERRRSWGVFNSLEDPPDFWHAETFAQLILLYMVTFVYSPIAPITSFFLAFCFVLLESGYRYQFIHNYPRAFETGGKLWKYFIRFTLASMVIAQLTLIGLLALKQSSFAGPALFPLLAITVLFIMYINANHSLVAEFLPTRECHRIDLENNAEGPMSMDFCKGAFLQPSLQPQVVEPNFDEDENDGNGESSSTV